METARKFSCVFEIFTIEIKSRLADITFRESLHCRYLKY